MGFAANVLVGVATLSIKYPIGGVYVDVGYTEDGVKFEYSVDKTQIRVEEKTYPLTQVINTEDLKVTANLAEATLHNLFVAIAGASQVGNIITIGNGVDKEMSVKIVGINPAGFARTVEIPCAVASGTVGLSWRKNEKTVIPVTFDALESPAGNLCTITDAVA
uniref:Uncharacterized protein n=1 Tax=viral metagenome TaxID=1070528 RepID=A0A6M3LU45_9ZZZZ